MDGMNSSLGGPRYKHRHSWTDGEGNTYPLRPDEIVDGVMQDGLSSVVHRGVYGDLFGLFSPSPHTDDRGRARLSRLFSGSSLSHPGHVIE